MNPTEYKGRLADLERGLDLLEQGQRKIAQLAQEGQDDVRRLAERADRTWHFGGFTPDGAHGGGANLSAWANTAMDAVEAWLFQRAKERNDPAARRAALDAVLAGDPTLRAHLTDADELAIIVAAPANPEAVDWRSVDSGRWRQQHNAPVLSGESVGLREREGFAEGDLYSPAKYAEAIRLGGGDVGEGSYRASRLRALARAHGLRLTVRDERAHAERLLFRELGAQRIEDVKSWDEGLAFLARDKPLTMSEADERDLGAKLAALRGDLCDSYGSRDRPAPGRKPHPDPADDEAAKLRAAATVMCREQSLPLTESNVQKAMVAIVRLRGGPNYRSDGDA